MPPTNANADKLNSTVLNVGAAPIEPAIDCESESPAERRRRKVRETILSVADDVFAREGEQGLSIRKLADAVDYSPAAIYKYFSSKDELMDALQEAFFARLHERIGERLKADPEAKTDYRGCVRLYVETALERPHHYASAFDGVRDNLTPSASKAHWDDFTTSEAGKAYWWLRTMVQRGIDEGAFRGDLNPSLAAKSLWASMHGLAMLMTHIPNFPGHFPDEPDTINQSAFIDYHADQIIRGMEESDVLAP